MKLLRTLHIDNTPYPVIEDRVVLDLSTPGRAMFVIDAKGDAISQYQVVSFSLGYSQHSTLQRLFLGYVETVNTIDKRVKIFCREFSAILNAPLPLQLRHVTLIDVLTEISDKTGLNFTAGNPIYSMKKVANFYNLGDGYQALGSIEKVFQINNYLWQQQGNGVIYVGSWEDSRWADRLIDFPETMFDQHLNNSVRLPAVPALRPGVKLNNKLIRQLQFSGNHMEIEWKR